MSLDWQDYKMLKGEFDVISLTLKNIDKHLGRITNFLEYEKRSEK